MHFSATGSASIKIFRARIPSQWASKIESSHKISCASRQYTLILFGFFAIIIKSVHQLFCLMHAILFFYSNFPRRFIISTLCSKREWAYRLSVIVAFLCPNSSERVLTSIPHSIARVANVCRKEWKPLCGIFSFFSRNSKVRWYERTNTGLSPSATIYSHSERFFIPLSRDNICFGNGITRREWTVFGLSIMRIWFLSCHILE